MTRIPSLLHPLGKFYSKYPENAIPPQERAGINHVFHLLNLMHSQLGEIENCITAFRYLEMKKHKLVREPTKGKNVNERHAHLVRKNRRIVQSLQWRISMARSGAMNIYHFGALLTAIKKQNGRYPTLHKIIKYDLLNEAEEAFKAAFPKIKRMRHAISHLGESINSVEKSESHRFHGNHFTSCLSGHSLIWTFKASAAPRSESLSIELSARTLIRLKAIMELTALAFEISSDTA